MATPQVPRAVEAEKKRKKSLVREYVEAIGIAILLALVIRTLVVQAFTIPSGSMMDTLQVGDYILVNKFLYGAEVPFTGWHLPGLRQPHRGDIVVFKYPLDEKRDFIKRIAAVPGDELVIRGNQIIINGGPAAEPYVKPGTGAFTPPRYLADRGSGEPCLAQAANAAERQPDQFGPIVIPRGHYFVMGDNRDNSQDSRYWGCLKREHIRGKAFLIYWSWNGEDGWLRWRRLGKIIW
ncbi:MAG: signal peptidase I [Candidatus Rokubacteria bacterium]|nr:signal peptidase I [Candidatus Rokubacteria bacterium]